MADNGITKPATRLDPAVIQAISASTLRWRINGPKLRVFVDEMESALSERLVTIGERYAEKLAEIRGATSGCVQVRADELDAYVKVERFPRGLPNLMRHSNLLIVFGVFEDHMAALCGDVHQTGKAPCAEPTGSHVPNSAKYLKALLNVTGLGNAWGFIDHAREIRNYVAHDAGFIRVGHDAGFIRDVKKRATAEKAEKARQFVAATDGISLDNDHIQFERSFIDRFLDEADGAFQEIEEIVCT